jgi:hypothetical protein
MRHFNPAYVAVGSITSQSAKAAPPSVSAMHPIATASHRNAVCREGPKAEIGRVGGWPDIAHVTVLP